MSVVKQKKGTKGSLKYIQELVNETQNRFLVDNKIKEAFDLKNSYSIEWLSPLKNENDSEKNFAEYRDSDFIKRLGVSINKRKLEDFWAPVRGPQWDALAKIQETETVFLFEAKANIPELKSSPTAAKEPSLTKIREALSETKKFLEVKNDVDWSQKFFQYTNRLAHLYFLRELNNIDANLVFIYFYNTKDKNDSNIPESIQKWQDELLKMKTHLGVNKNNNLSPYIKEIFIDIKNIIN